MKHFGELAVGQTFDWVGPNRFNSFFAPCRKTAKRAYTDGQFYYKVGSLKAEVFHVDEFTVSDPKHVEIRKRIA